ncbi:hypothetical protein QW131_14630 [Roseibium salinum]|nr:hypothetical protein [Roseibium salinum]
MEDALAALGFAYFHGEWVDVDDVLARDYLRRATENGHTFAAHYLGYMQEEGLGGPRDIEAARKSYELGATGDNPDAAVRLAYLAGEGRGDDADAWEVLKWKIRAGELGDEVAAYEAAEALTDGTLRRDLDQAARLYRIAADQGNVDASVKWARMQILGEVESADFGAGLQEMQRVADQHALSALAPLTQLISKDAETGGRWPKQRETDLFLGLAYAYGIVLPKNMDKAEEHLRRAVDMDPDPFPPAQFALAKALMDMRPETAETNAEIMRLVTLAANNGNVSAQFTLGLILGPGTLEWRQFGAKNSATALMWYRQAAKHSLDARHQVAVAIAEKLGWQERSCGRR